MPDKHFHNEKICATILCIGILTISGCAFIHNDMPIVQNGYIDISSWPFKLKHEIKLEGEWQYKFKEPACFGKDFQAETWDEIHVPGYWNGKENNSFGYCTLKLRIKNNIQEKLCLYIEYANTSYELYINNTLSLTNGVVGRSRQESVPQNIPLSVELPQTEYLDVVWIIANFSDIYGGATNAPVINTSKQMEHSVWFHASIDSLLLGIILAIFLYNFILWMGRKDDKRSLFLSIFSLIIFLRLFTICNILESLFPDIGLFEIRKKIEYVTMALGWIFFNLYIYNLFPEDSKRIIISIFKYSGLVLCLTALVTPVYFYTRFLIVYQIMIVLSIMNLIFIISFACIRKRAGSVIIFLGSGLLFITVINDILVANKIINNINLISSGIILFVLIQSVMVSNLLSKAFRTLEHLSRNLQAEVESRTLELQQAKDQIEQQSKQKTTFFINLAHEIKTPLTLINNYFEHYLEENFNDAVPDDLAVVKDYLEHTTGDIVNLLEMQGLERGEIRYKHDLIIDIEDALSKTVQVFMQAVKNKRITFTSQALEYPYAKIHPYAFDRIINNVLENAVKYTKNEIVITLKAGYGNIFIEIADNGPGIPNMHQEKIFNPYYQISREKSNFQGMGMGLAIVNRILSQVRGKIALKNKPDNSGLVATIILPRCILSKENESMLIKEYTPKTPVKKTIETKLLEEVYEKGRATVFFVEDNRELVSFFQKAMYKEFNFFFAFNGEEALQKIGEMEKPDIIISDIMMDTMDGYEFHENIVKNETLNDIPFLFLTARTNLHEKLECLSKGAIDYIYKPFSMKEVLEKVRAIVKNRKAQTEQMKKTLAPSPELKAEEEAIYFEKVCKEHKITKKEKLVIKEFLKGLLNKEIGTNLFMSENTVRNHIKHIYGKFRINTKIELYNKFKV